jgi:hypothetical protein
MAEHQGDQGTTTWASRNPLKDVQPSRQRIRPHHTDAERMARDKKRQLNRTNAAALKEDIDTFFAERDERIAELAKKHSRKPSYIRLLLTNATHYTNPRAPTLKNALVHHKTKEVNESKCLFYFIDD